MQQFLSPPRAAADRRSLRFRPAIGDTVEVRDPSSMPSSRTCPWAHAADIDQCGCGGAARLRGCEVVAISA